MPIRKIISNPKMKTAFLTLSDQVVHSGTTFLTGVLVGRLLSVGEFGQFSLGLTLMVFSMVLQDNCLATPYTYRFHHSGADKHAIMRAGALIQSFMLSIFCSVLLLIAYLFMPKGEEASLYKILLTLAFAMPFLFIRETSRRLYFTEFRILETLKMDILVSTLQVSLIVGIWWFDLIGTASVFAMIALASLAGSFWAVARNWREYDFRNADVKGDTMENIRFGRWLMIGSFCHLGSMYAFPWLLYAIAGDETAGSFAACYTLINLLNPLILGFNNFFRPKIMQTYAHHGWEAMHALVMKLVKLFFPVAVFIVLFFAVGGGLLVRLVYGAAFSDLGLIMGIVGVSVFSVILNAPLQLGILALNRPQINPKFHAVAFASTVCIGIPLMLNYGMTGAAIGYSLSVSAGFAALIYFYVREIRHMRQAGK